MRELIVDIDDARRRLVWSAVGGRLTHHNASAQVLEHGPERSRVVWIADLLPHELAPAIATMMDAGIATLKATLDRTYREPQPPNGAPRTEQRDAGRPKQP